MKKSTISLLLIFAIVGGIVITTSSCKKSKLNRETTTDEDNSLAESSFDDVFKNVNQSNATAREKNLFKTAEPQEPFGSPCATVTMSDANNNVIAIIANDTLAFIDSTFLTAPFPRNIVIDFGNGCTGNDGKTRKGKLKATMSSRFWIVGCVITTTPENYFVNDYAVEGIRTDTYVDSVTPTWTVKVESAKITSPDGKTVTWESERTRKRTAGGATPFNIFDDVYYITGNASGINREGRNFTVTITTDLRVNMNCGGGYTPEIVSGILEIQPEGLKLRTVDYGDGTCDNEAKVTAGNKSKTFKLRK